MSTALTLYNELPATQTGSNADFEDISKSAGFLGLLKLYGGNSKVVKKGLVPIGTYGAQYGKDKIEHLGASVDIIPFARKPQALDMSVSPPLRSYDKSSDEYNRIKTLSGQPNSSAQYGISFLVWERTLGCFLEFFCGGASSRPEAKNIATYCPISAADIAAMSETERAGKVPCGPRPCTLIVDFVDKGDIAYHAPIAIKCSTPFANLPSKEAVVAEMTKFLTVPVVAKKIEGATSRPR